MTLLRRIFPAPLLSLALVALWLVLSRSASVDRVILGMALGLIVPLLTTGLLPRAKVRRPLVIARFILTVGRDVLMSNIEIAIDVVFWRWRRPEGRFVVIPLELRHPTALTALAMVATVVPGTVWSELALDRSAVMIHVWNAPDEGAFIEHFKRRYEAPLREIFE